MLRHGIPSFSHDVLAAITETVITATQSWTEVDPAVTVQTLEGTISVQLTIGASPDKLANLQDVLYTVHARRVGVVTALSVDVEVPTASGKPFPVKVFASTEYSSTSQLGMSGQKLHLVLEGK